MADFYPGGGSSGSNSGDDSGSCGGSGGSGSRSCGSCGGSQRESLDERQAKIDAACSSFIAIGFRPELFTINNLLNYGYTETKFLELIEPISSIKDQGALTFLFNTARQSLYQDPSLILPPNDFSDFINCINWLKRDELAMLNNQMSKEDVTLARTLVDSAAPLMQERMLIQNRLMELETECARVSGELKLMLGPIYGYEEPSMAELRFGCYRLHVEYCIFRGMTDIPELDGMGYETVVHTFGSIVKQRHLIKFMNDPVRKELVQTYLKGFAAMGGHGF